jgi:hypothetical protein
MRPWQQPTLTRFLSQSRGKSPVFFTRLRPARAPDRATIAGASFELAFELAFELTFELAFELAFELTFELAFELTFELAFELTFEL